MILGICGAGGLGREVLELADQINKIYNKWSKIIFIETEHFISNKTINITKNEVKTFDEAIIQYDIEDINFIIAVGEPIIREKISNKINSLNYNLTTLIHPNVHIPKSTKINKGVVICSQAIISCDVEIKNNVYIQPNALIGHDCIIEENTVISGLVHLAGKCHVGQNTYLGMNVCVKENVSIGKYSIIGMASVVMKDIPDYVIALGNPARPLRKNEDLIVFRK